MKAIGFALLLIGLLLPQMAAAQEWGEESPRGKISIFDARKMALEMDPGRIDRLDRYGEKGNGLYRLEMLQSDKSANVIWLDEHNGAVMGYDLYRLSDDTVLPPGSIRQKQAKKIALDYIGVLTAETGAVTDPKIYDVKYNLVDGNVAYQLGVRVRDDRYTVFVDPQSGQVLGYLTWMWIRPAA